MRVLDEIGVHAVYIDDAATRDIKINDTIDPETRQEAISGLQSSFTSFSNRATTVEAKERIIDDCRSIVQRIMEDLNKVGSAIISLIDLKSFDNYTYAHSVNTAVLAGIVGMELDYGEEKIFKLVFGALLHDVGKITIPEPVMSKPTSLTEAEWQQVKKHPEDGWIMLKDMFGVPPTSRNVCLQHHERFDGGGYPRGKMGMDIHEFARVMAIVDVYDALTSDRPYRKRHPAHEAIEYLYANGNAHFDINLLKVFIGRIAPYPLATSVQLSNGLRGIVAFVDERLPSRPVIRVTHDAAGKEVTPYDFELAGHIDVTILEVLEDVENGVLQEKRITKNRPVKDPPPAGESKDTSAESPAGEASPAVEASGETEAEEVASAEAPPAEAEAGAADPAPAEGQGPSDELDAAPLSEPSESGEAAVAGEQGEGAQVISER